MDPYLEDEQLWPAFHQGLVTGLYQILLPGLVDRYLCRVTHRHYHPEQASEVPATLGDRQETYVEIVERSDGKLITLLDVVSPGNKTTAPGRMAYLETRRQAKSQGASIVEIDLVLQGSPMLDYSRDGLPDWDYAVTVTRATQPDRFEIYTSTLEKKLPRFRLPLASDARDTVVDLQTLFARTYDQGNFASRIDYQRDPLVPLSAEESQWLRSLLQEKKLRVAEPAFSHEEIATAAYYLWQQDGCPQGRAEEYWYRAMEQLKQGRRTQPENS
jgi:Protein of unknown function (DUF4058)/Protein of unknown function (DUF2934)